ncbi:unnamed protein product [Lactuca saligna]|uniref:Uncharacterized protein n=1 Tax=Lactuca saligna TaxID=75948 RepID=A0AA35V6A6_LACSI|nr:unnamed protein product [Lactuca saligna]
MEIFTFLCTRVDHCLVYPLLDPSHRLKISSVNVISLFFHKPPITFSPLLFLRRPIISGEQLNIEGIVVPKVVVVFAASAVASAGAKRFRELHSPTRKALQRAMFYFKEPIRCLLIGSTRSFQTSSRPILDAFIIKGAKRDFSTTILERKKAANRLTDWRYHPDQGSFLSINKFLVARQVYRYRKDLNDEASKL